MKSPLVNPDQRSRDGGRSMARFWQCAALTYAAMGVLAMWLLSPRVPYADQWNHYAHLLQRPFWIGVFSADNGHAEVLPNLLRLIELHIGSHETLQIAYGILCAAISVGVLLGCVARDAQLTPQARAACAFGVVFGIYWLGNTRALTQEHDAAHVYTVLLCLSLALRLCLSPSVARALPWRNLAIAIALCGLASLSFGSGIASFGAVAVLLILQRARVAQIALVIAAAVATAFLYRALPGAVVDRASYSLDTDVIVLTLRLLGSPFVYLFWPLLDPAAASAVPEPLRGVCVSVANGWTAQFGDIHFSVFPQAALGALAVAAMLRTTSSAWRTDTAPSARIGVALAWFGVGVAALIAITRATYFVIHPDQIYAPRYMPWLTLGWSGLLIAGVARVSISRAIWLIAASLPLVALPSQIGMAVLARHMQNVAEDIALAATVGVFPYTFTLRETDLDDLHEVTPLLRDAQTAMFAWPEAKLLDQPVPTSAQPLAASEVRATLAQNRLGDTVGSEITANFDGSCRPARALVVADGKVIGLLRAMDDRRWRGVAQGEADSTALTFYGLCR